MTSRRNDDRVGTAAPAADPPLSEMMENNIDEDIERSPAASLSFTTPTEFVVLPSRGRFYSTDHPLYNADSVEIRYMTAKDEDILTSKTLLKKGIAIDRFLQNVIIDKKVKVQDLLSGDKNALTIAARITGYGAEYDTKAVCPMCGSHSEYSFDLGEGKVNFGDNFGGYDIRETPEQTFIVLTPTTGTEVEIRLLTGRDEKNLLALQEKKKRHKLAETGLTDQFRMFIVSVNGNSEQHVVSSYIDNMPAMDSKYLRDSYKKITPNVDLTQEYECDFCGYAGEMEVPFTTDFFWPK